MIERVNFSAVNDVDITLSIIDEFHSLLRDHVRNDVVVVGAGPAGLVCARELAKEGCRVLLLERNNYLGGGFWMGGFLMNKLTVRSPAHEELESLGVRLKEVRKGIFVADAAEACSKLIASACDAGVAFLNMVSVEDVVVQDGRVEGVVVNWSPVSALPRQITCVDPISIGASVVVDATGHEASVCRRLADRGMVEIAGMGTMNADRSEVEVVEKTSEVFPGVIAAGMSVSTVFGIQRMGPTFGGMIYSGKRAAQLALEILKGATVSTGK